MRSFESKGLCSSFIMCMEVSQLQLGSVFMCLISRYFCSFVRNAFNNVQCLWELGYVLYRLPKALKLHLNFGIRKTLHSFWPLRHFCLGDEKYVVSCGERWALCWAQSLSKPNFELPQSTTSQCTARGFTVGNSRTPTVTVVMRWCKTWRKNSINPSCQFNIPYDKGGQNQCH